MMNPKYHFAKMRELLDEFLSSRERSLAVTKLDECEMWLEKCTPTREALATSMTPLFQPGAGYTEPETQASEEGERRVLAGLAGVGLSEELAKEALACIKLQKVLFLPYPHEES